jgi:RHS repeat-associated protein
MELYYNDQLTVDDVSSTPLNDGKITAMHRNSANLKEVQTYLYTYDDLNRLESATYLPSNKYDVFYKYDLNGNITNLLRNGQLIQKSKKDEIGAEPSTEFYYGAIDNLSYSYAGNQLSTVKDEVGEIETELNNDFRELKNDSETEYSYDKNGNMIADMNKGMKIKYNHLNQPTLVDLGNKRIEYLYTASGGMLQSTTYIESKKDNTTDYAGAFVYQNNSLSYINIPGGRITQRIEKAVLIEKYEYHLTDHLGNVRVTFAADNMGNAEILQEDHYYPFGLRMSGMHYSNTELLNKFLYNGKELQEQTGWYDYGFRQMDPQLARWHVIDAMTESYYSHTPYAYTMNDPVNFTDLLGLKALPQLSSDDDWSVGVGQMDYVEGEGWQWFSNHTSGISSGNTGSSGISRIGPNILDDEDYEEYEKAKEKGYDGTYSEWWNELRQLQLKNGDYLEGGLVPIYGRAWAGSGNELSYQGVWLKGYASSSVLNAFNNYALDGYELPIIMVSKKNIGLRLFMSRLNYKVGDRLFIVGAHGHFRRIIKANGDQLDPSEFISYLNENSAWRNAMESYKPITLVLLGCNLAAREIMTDDGTIHNLLPEEEPFAHILSQKLGENVTVIAPNGKITAGYYRKSFTVYNHLGNAGFIKIKNGKQIGGIITDF